MNNDDFNASVQTTVDRSLEVLVSKNDGYSPNADKLDQFKLAANGKTLLIGLCDAKGMLIAGTKREK